MKVSVFLLVLSVLVTGCVGHEVHYFKSGVDKFANEVPQDFIDDGHTYKLLKIYDVNAVIPTLTYPILHQCDLKGANCVALNITPIQQPGVVTGLAGPAIQGMSFLAGMELIRQGQRGTGTSVSQRNNGGNGGNGGDGGNASSSSTQSQSNFHNNGNGGKK